MSWLLVGSMMVGLGMSSPARVEGLSATFIGNMAFHITDGTAALITDFPYESGAFGYMKWSRDHVPVGQGPLCLVTHSHRDHFLLRLASEFCGIVLGPDDVTRAGKLKALEMKNEVLWEGITFRPLATPHASLEHYSYVVEWRGLRLYFTGDTEDTASLLAARELDVAFVSPWLLRTVQKQGRRIDARQIVVYHHRDAETVVEIQDRIVPRPGQVLSLGLP